MLANLGSGKKGSKVKVKGLTSQAKSDARVLSILDINDFGSYSRFSEIPRYLDYIEECPAPAFCRFEANFEGASVGCAT